MVPSHLNRSDMFIQPNHDVLDSSFDKAFRLGDFFEAEPDKALWRQLDDRNRSVDSCDVEATKDLLLPSDTFIDRGITSVRPNSSLPTPQSRGSLKAGTTQPKERSSPNIKSDPFTEAAWQEILEAVSPIYLEKSVKEILEILPERSTHKPSRKQLKTRIKLWHEKGLLPRKNIDKKDMDYMTSVGLMKEAQGLEAVFTYHGFPVSQEKLKKHRERFGITRCHLNPQAPPPHITWTTFSVLRTTRQTTVDKTPNSPDSTEPAEAAPVAQDLNSDIMGYFDTLEPKYPSGNLNNLSDRNTFIPRIPLNALEDSIMDDGDGIASAVVARSDEQVPAAPEENSHLIPPINTASLSASNGNIYPETLGTGRRQRAGSEKKSLVTENCGPEVTATFEAVTKVEAKCVQVIDYLAPHLVPSLRRPYGRSQSLNTYSWQTLIALHETLLYEYKDLMLGIQHPAASPGLGRLALECSMPARMWKHGCHSLLELLRRFLPITRDHMVRFISIAYRIYAALYKTVSQFSGTWAEVLGGLAKRRANIAGEDIEEHKYWQRKSQEWYTSAADRNPSEGRFYHHLATLSQPAHIKQLYYICRSLTSGTIFPSAREMIITQFSRGSESSADPRRAFLKHFTRTHFSLFRKDFSEAHQQALEFLRSLDVSSAYPPTRWLEESTQIAIINVASLLDYGNPTPLRYAFDFSNDRSRPSATGDGKAEGFPLTSGDPLIAGVSDLLGYRLKSELIFDTMETICSFNMGLGLPHFHVVMAFLFSLAKTLALTRRIFASGLVDLQLVLEQVPWGSLCEFLNGSIFNIPRKGHVHPFPLASSDPLRPLPEDYMLRGLIWTADYFPSNWFETHVDMDDRFLDSTSSSKLRVERIIWLAHQLCSYGYMVFDNGFFSEASPSPFERDDICPCTLKSWVKSHACDSRAKFGLERHPSVSSHKAVIPQPCGTSSDASITCLSPSSPDMMDMIMDRAEAPYGKSWSAVVGSPYIQECAKRRAL